MKTIYKNALLFLVLTLSINIFSITNKKSETLADCVLKNSSSLKKQPVFVPLEIGAVIPQGWLLDWSKESASGITGHLDELASTFAEGWKGKGFKALGTSEKDGLGWSLEQCSYWLDGGVRLAYILKDSALIKKISERLDMVVNGVLNGGETFIYWKDKSVITNPETYIGWSDFNGWAHSHMGRALVAYYQATRNEKILKALIKVYRHYPLSNLTENFETVTGACNVDPMLETLMLSGDTAIFNNLKRFSQRNEYQKISKNWLDGNLIPGHGVVYYEDIRIPALVYLITKNKNDLIASEHAINWGESKYLLPVGLCSSEEFHAGIGATRNIETCVVTASMWTFNWMLRITGQKEYADKIEKIFFNAAPAPVSRDFKTMCYYQSSNRYSTEVPGVDPICPGKDAYKFTPIGHKVLCCVGNNCRIIPNYIMHMWMATADNGLAATLYGPCKVSSIVGKTPVNIDCETAYPFEDRIHITVTPDQPLKFPLYFRIPQWCGQPEIKINGQVYNFDQGSDQFVKITRQWKPKDIIDLYFPMVVKITQGRETPYPKCGEYFKNYHKMAQDSTINNPFAYINYGPLLFSLPIADENPNKEREGVKYNYALNVHPDNTKGIEIIRTPMPKIWQWQLDAPLKLIVDAKEFNWTPTENNPLPNELIKSNINTRIELVPYGCTKFRVTMFPVTKETWILP